MAGASELADRPRSGHGARERDARCGAGDLIAIDGTTGHVTTDDVPLVEPRAQTSTSSTVLEWADELRRARASARTRTRPRTRARARELGAEGIGLCRTEHMFMQADRQPKMRRMIIGRDEDERAQRRSTSCCRSSGGTSRGSFEAMEGCPVTIRLLDPPLHEFLPKKEELVVEIERRAARAAASDPR